MHNTFAFDLFVGESPSTRQARRDILEHARHDNPVLIQGPGGSGRELIARGIHAHSSRADRPFIPFRPATLPSSLAATQLCGQASIATRLGTGPTLGCLGAARGGTLFIDEVTDLDEPCQQHLLQAIRDGQVTPVGSDTSIDVEVRVIASTSRDLDEEIRRGRFSFELAYRLNLITIDVLPLKDRVDDIAPLVRHHLARITLDLGLELRQITHPAMSMLETYDWPGNVAELVDHLELAVTDSDDLELDLNDFPAIIDALTSASPAEPASAQAEQVSEHERVLHVPVVARPWPTLDELEATHLRATLEKVRNNVRAAARMLRMDQSDLECRMRRHRIAVPIESADLDPLNS